MVATIGRVEGLESGCKCASIALGIACVKSYPNDILVDVVDLLLHMIAYARIESNVIICNTDTSSIVAYDSRRSYRVECYHLHTHHLLLHMLA